MTEDKDIHIDRQGGDNHWGDWKVVYWKERLIEYGEEIPASEIDSYKNGMWDIAGVRFEKHPETVSFATGFSMWDATRKNWALIRITVGVSHHTIWYNKGLERALLKERKETNWTEANL